MDTKHESEIERAINHYESLIQYDQRLLIDAENRNDQAAEKELTEAMNEQTLVLVALRAQQEQESCEYCSKKDSKNNSGRVFYKELPHDTRFLTTLDDAHLQLAYDQRSGWVLHFENAYGNRMFDIRVYKCPICGRQLNNEQNGTQL
jgi:rubrerythrin